MLGDELLRRMTAGKDTLADSLFKKITNRSSLSSYAHLFTRDHAKAIVDERIARLTPKVPKLPRPNMGRPKLSDSVNKKKAAKAVVKQRKIDVTTENLAKRRATEAMALRKDVLQRLWRWKTR